MDVTVKLFASLRPGRLGERIINLNQNCTVERAIQDLGIPPDQVAIMLVNDRQVDPGYHLSAGDALSLFPPLGGG